MELKLILYSRNKLALTNIGNSRKLKKHIQLSLPDTSNKTEAQQIKRAELQPGKENLTTKAKTSSKRLIHIFRNKLYLRMPMRCLTLILATFILFLCVKPGIDLLISKADTQETCCSKRCATTTGNTQQPEQDKDNSCDSKTCNPFQVCNSCVLFCIHTPVDIPLQAIFLFGKEFTYQSDFKHQFAPDFWQPPKIV